MSIRSLRVFDSFYKRYFLGRRDLLLLWLGQLAAGFGDSLAFVGFLFLVLSLTGSERQVGLFQAVAYLPIIIFGLAAGVYVDRRDRKRVMLLADGGRALALLSLPLAAWLGFLDIWYAGLVVMLVTTLTTFFNPAYNSALPIIVDDPSKLFGVNAIMQSSRQFAAIAGPLFAAIGAGGIGALGLLSVNATTYIVSFVCVAAITTSLSASNRGRISLGELRDEVASGLRVVVGNPSVRAIFLLTLVNNFLLMGPAVVGTPLLVRNVFGGDMGDIAMIDLMYALGMTITGFALHRFPSVQKIGWLWGIGLVVDGLTYLLYLPADTLWKLYLATFIHALAIPLIVVPRATMIQRLLPSDMLGRAFGYIDISVFGVTALSAGVTGFVSAEIGPRLAIVIGGTLAGLVGLVALAMKAVRGVEFDA